MPVVRCGVALGRPGQCGAVYLLRAEYLMHPRQEKLQKTVILTREPAKFRVSPSFQETTAADPVPSAVMCRKVGRSVPGRHRTIITGTMQAVLLRWQQT